MNILALETSTDACSVALRLADGMLFSEFEIVPRKHTYYLPRMMDSVLDRSGIKKSSIQAIAYANGPGAFTGVRIAAASAQGIAMGLGIPVIPVSTLAVLAQAASDEFSLDNIQVALDARMGEAYCAMYTKNPLTALVRLVGEARLVKLEHLQQQAGVHSVGSGFLARRQAGYSEEGDVCKYEDVYPSARALAKLAGQGIGEQQTLRADAATINYIRNRVAEKKKKRK